MRTKLVSKLAGFGLLMAWAVTAWAGPIGPPSGPPFIPDDVILNKSTAQPNKTFNVSTATVQYLNVSTITASKAIFIGGVRLSTSITSGASISPATTTIVGPLGGVFSTMTVTGTTSLSSVTATGLFSGQTIHGSSAVITGTITGSNLTGTNTGDVTIGTSNGLSLAGQAVSMGVSGTTSTGALRSTDYNTFNGKLDPGGDGSDLTGLTKTQVGLGNVLNVDQTNASNLSSGTVGTARLGSGTASSARYLRGDQSWQLLNSTAVGLGAVTNDKQVKVSDYTQKGGILVGISTGVFSVLPPGTNNKYLRTNSAVATGVEWTTQNSGVFPDGILAGTGTFTGLLTGTTVQMTRGEFTTIAATTMTTTSITASSATFTDARIGTLNGVIKGTSGLFTGSATTTDMPEGSNLYYTLARSTTDVIPAVRASTGTYSGGNQFLGVSTFTGNVAIASGTFNFLTVGSTLTLPSGYKQRFTAIHNFKDPPYNGGTGADDTAAFNSALAALPDGAALLLPAGYSYNITSTVTVNTVNRITILGEGLESNVNFTPSYDNATGFLVTGAADTIRFSNFGVNQTNPTISTGTVAFRMKSGATNVEWDHVYTTAFSRAAIYVETGCLYIRIHDGRFIRTNDTTGAYLASAILSEGMNVYRIQNNFFSENDREFQIPGGTTGLIQGNSFESGGQSGNPLIDNTFAITGTNGLTISNNYFEGEYNNGGSVIRLNNTINTLIENNQFSGEEGATPVSGIFITNTGASSENVIVRLNKFVNPITGFGFSDSVSTMTWEDNSYTFANVKLHTRNEILNYMTNPQQFDINVGQPFSYDPASLSSMTVTSSTFSVLGATFTDIVSLSLPYNMQGVWSQAYPSSGDILRVDLFNPTGSTVNLATGTYSAIIRKRK